MKFILKQSADTAMDDPIVMAILDLLKKEVGVKRIGLKEIEDEATDSLEENEDEQQDLLKLEIKTKSKVIQVYHQELLRKIMNIPGFYAKLHHHKAEIISDEKGKITFLLKQSADTAMDDPVIKAVLEFLQNEDRVKRIGMNEVDPAENKKVETVKQKPKLTQAVVISFSAKSENVREFAAELLKECEEIEYFKYKMYERKVSMIREDKVKFQFVMYHSGENAMEDPDMLAALSLFKDQENIRKLKVEAIPYFLES